MTNLETDRNEIRVFYQPGNNLHEKTVAHAKGSGKEVLATPFSDAPSAYNVWTAIYEGLTQDELDNFFDKEDDRYERLLGGGDYTFEDWRKICLHNPDLIKYPIAVSGEQIIQVRRPSEVYRLQELGPEANKSNIAPENKAHASQADIDEGDMMLDR